MSKDTNKQQCWLKASVIVLSQCVCFIWYEKCLTSCDWAYSNRHVPIIRLCVHILYMLVTVNY